MSVFALPKDVEPPDVDDDVCDDWDDWDLR